MQISTLRVGYLVHAYRQAPWRLQRQWLGAFLLAVFAIAMVSSLYLDITAQAAISGREIQGLTADIAATGQTNADLQTQVAVLTATDAMEARAKELGYQPIDPTKLQYVVVPGYTQAKPLTPDGAPALQPSAPTIPPEYTESLIEWLQKALQPAPAVSMMGISQ